MFKPIARARSWNAGVLRTSAVAAFTRAAAAIFLSGLALREASAQSSFDDDFDSATYNNLDAVDNLSLWEANPGTNGVSNPTFPYISKSGGAGVAIVPIRANQNGFMQPIDSLGNPASWPFARTCEEYLRVEFDLIPTLMGPSGSGPDGVIGVYFSSVPQQRTFNDPGPLAAILFSWKSGGTASAQIWAMGSGASPVTVGPAINLGSIDAGRKFRVEFGWDYFTLPNKFKPAGQWPPSQGDPWVNLRLSWYDSVALSWVHPDAGPGRNGWFEFGTATRNNSSYAGQQEQILGFTRYDWWNDPVTHQYLSVFPHWYAEKPASGSDVDWALDNVHIRQVTPQAFSIMSNELGYDPAGHQWVAMRPNDPTVRALGANAIATLAWTLRDSSGGTLASQANVAPVGERCFQDVVDPEEWYGTGQFTFEPVFWWRYEWTLPSSFTGTSGAYVVADGTLAGTGTHFSATSDPFDILPDLAYATLINAPNNLAAFNSLMRHAYTHIPWTTAPTPPASAGEFDAGAENGEERSHGLFVSAQCNVLRQRRSELSTQQVRDLVSEIRWSADFLLAMAAPENNDFTRRTHHLQQDPVSWDKTLAGHHLSSDSSPTPSELAGHVFHEHTSRYPARTPSDDKDQLNVALRVYIGALGLYDAARTLKNFVQSPTTSTDLYFAQASDTRAYLNELPLYWPTQSNGKADFFIPFRGQAMLDLAAFDYSALSSDLDAARSKIVSDLQTRPPSTSANIRKFWILGGLFSNAPQGPMPDLSAYTPFEPLVYFVEHAVPEWPPTTPPHATWQEALNNIGEFYYHLTLLPETGGNPLRITRNWPPDVDATEYWGDDVFSNKKVAEEAYATARLAQNAKRTGANYDRFVQLATGDLNWILGLHRGVLARHVKSASGITDSDLQFSPASFVNGVGRRAGIHVVYAIHAADWTQPTVLSGLGGFITPGLSGFDWPVAPFEFSRGQYDTSEGYIKTDGNVLMAVETLGRVLHPRGVVEAENYSSAHKAAGGSPTAESNNEWNAGGTDRPNGGLSVVDMNAGDWLQWNVMPPEPSLGANFSNIYNYTILVRAGNSSAADVTATLVVTSPGLPTWTGNVLLTVTGDKHEYVVANTAVSSPIPIKSGVVCTIQLQFPGGPCSVDDLVLVSGGVMQ